MFPFLSQQPIEVSTEHKETVFGILCYYCSYLYVGKLVHFTEALFMMKQVSGFFGVFCSIFGLWRFLSRGARRVTQGSEESWGGNRKQEGCHASLRSDPRRCRTISSQTGRYRRLSPQLHEHRRARRLSHSNHDGRPGSGHASRIGSTGGWGGHSALTEPG